MSDFKDIKKSEFDNLVRNVMFAADDAAMLASAEGATGATKTRRAVEAALQSALGNGLVTMVPSEEWPSQWIAMEPASHPIKIVED